MLVILNWSQHAQSLDLEARLRSEGLTTCDLSSAHESTLMDAAVCLSTHRTNGQALVVHRIEVAPYEVLVAELLQPGAR